MPERVPNTPPSGRRRPLDPWAEQARRNHADRAGRRRSRWILVAALASIAVAVVVGVLAIYRDADAPTLQPVGTASSVPASTTDVTAPDGTDLDERGAVAGLDRPVDLEEVWLVQRADGSSDWGVTIASTDDVDRGPIEVVATFLDGDGAVVASERAALRRLPAGRRGASVGGAVVDPTATPERIEVDVSQGRALDDRGVTTDELRVVAVERRRMPSGGAVDEPVEAIVGRLRSSAEEEIGDLRLALLWRDERGDVVASRFVAVDRVRPGIDARFEVPLEDGFVADGPPDDVSWSYGP